MRAVAVVGIVLLGAVAWGGSGVTLEAESTAPGEVFPVRVAGLGGAGPYEVSFGAAQFPLWPAEGGWEGLAAVDRDAAPGVWELRLLGPDGAERPLAAATVVVGERVYPEQRLTVRESMVTLSPEDQARAAREAARIRQVLSSRSPRRLWDGPVRIPVEGPVSSPFGVRRFYNDQPRGYHSGIDLAAPRGTPVGAAAAGVVALTGDFFYTGGSVFLDHGLGLLTGYFHLDSVEVNEGETVPAGGLLGRVGSTGRSTGPHLHWGVYLSGVRADPFTLVRAAGEGAAGGEGP
ncbi:MAG: M23 family metallopeptidase [Deferrisomatales bacterium]|nr:M23 family metallopeptidase [Deferrisomatales bacterium]